MTSDGYPDEDELNTIEKWDFKHPNGFLELMQYVRDRWAYIDFGWHEEVSPKDKVTEKHLITYSISTAGWSGNEDLIEALRSNLVFWSLCWYSSRRGGHYEFRVML